MAKSGSLYCCRMSAGAYGFELAGAADVDSHLLVAAPDWPALELVRRTGVVPLERNVVGRERAEIALVAGDHLAVNRNPLRATFTTSRPLSDDALVHPYLAPAAAIAGYWLGREAFHAGALLLDGGVWAIGGDKGAGKSTLGAGLSRRGHRIFTDDALLVDGEIAFAGPRSLDLREEGFGSESIGVVGDRERWRLRLADVPATSRLRGWVFLSWGATVDVTPISAGELLQRLLAGRMIKGLPPPDPKLLLDLSALPAFELSRPRGLAQLETAVSRLVDVLADR